MANTSPEPFSNWILSLLEDVFVIGFGNLTMAHPLVALVVAIVLLILVVVFLRVLLLGIRAIWRRLTRQDAGQLKPALGELRAPRR